MDKQGAEDPRSKEGTVSTNDSFFKKRSKEEELKEEAIREESKQVGVEKSLAELGFSEGFIRFVRDMNDTKGSIPAGPSNNLDLGRPSSNSDKRFSHWENTSTADLMLKIGILLVLITVSLVMLYSIAHVASESFQDMNEHFSQDFSGSTIDNLNESAGLGSEDSTDIDDEDSSGEDEDTEDSEDTENF